MSIHSTNALFYNIWGHRRPDDLHDFLRSLEYVDVMCLTEVTDIDTPYETAPTIFTGLSPAEPATHLNGLEQLRTALGDRYTIRYTSPRSETKICVRTGTQHHHVGFGSALLYKPDLNVIATGDELIELVDSDSSDRVLQWIAYEKGGVRYLIAHLHGVWIRDNTKGDSPLRDFQSMCVIEHLSRLQNLYGLQKVVFGGDLNLDLSTRAINLLEYTPTGAVRFRNLIRENDVSNTRTDRYREYGKPGKSMHADYVFVTPDVDVWDFNVRNKDNASDHAPVIVTYS